jgi:hypothetical protein
MTAVSPDRPERNRRKREVGHRVIDCARISKRRLRLLGVDYPEAVEHPKARADCKLGLRPCPYIGCRYHLWCDVKSRGNITVNFGDLEPDEMVTPSCALDVVDAHPEGVTLETVGEYLNCTREFVRQIEAAALRKLRRNPETPRQLLAWVEDD